MPTFVAGNYRAVRRARSRAEFIAKLGVVVEEADESACWLELLGRLELGQAPERSWLLREATALLAITAAARKTARGNLQNEKDLSESMG